MMRFKVPPVKNDCKLTIEGLSLKFTKEVTALQENHKVQLNAGHFLGSGARTVYVSKEHRPCLKVQVSPHCAPGSY